MSKIVASTFFVLYLLMCQFKYQEVFADAKINDPANEILKKMEKAINTEALKTTKGFYFKMSNSIPAANVSGACEITATNNKAYLKISIAGMDQSMGYDGKKAWSKDITQGVREMTGQEKESIIHATIDFMKNQKAFYTEILSAPDEKFENKECLVLIYKKEGVPDRKVFVDKTTFLPSGSIEDQEGPQGKITVKSIFHSYKKCENGYLMPDSLTQDMGIMKMKINLTEIKINPTIDEKIFNQPEN